MKKPEEITNAIHKLHLTDWEARQLFFFTLGVISANSGRSIVEKLSLIHEEALLIIKTRPKGELV